VIAVSQGVKDCVVKWVGVAPEHVEVIYNPVILPEHRRAARAAVDHPFFAADAPPVVLVVGRLTRLKNFALLMRAFARVLRARDARLVVLGEGEQRSELESLAQTLGIGEAVAMPGYVANPHAFMAKAAVLALSSDSEGLPTVLIEALASGTPVVATDCPTGPREILDGGRLGRLVPVGDEAALAEAIEATLAAPTAAATPRDLARFTVPVATAAYLRAMGL
jgi:glycosyltransferase involved in cell wall biosynthesis